MPDASARGILAATGSRIPQIDWNQFCRHGNGGRIVEGMAVTIWEQQTNTSSALLFSAHEWSEAMENMAPLKGICVLACSSGARRFRRKMWISLLRDDAAPAHWSGLARCGIGGFLQPKKLDELTEWVKRQEIGPAKGLICSRSKDAGVAGTAQKISRRKIRRELLGACRPNRDTILSCRRSKTDTQGHGQICVGNRGAKI
jgi:hypothetical protein